MTEVEIPLRRQRRSVSQVTSYSSCGEAYRLQRIARAPTKPAAWFPQGHATHHGIEEWENSKRTESRERIEERVRTAFITEANALLEKTSPELWMKSGVKKTETDLTDRLELSVWQAHDYMDWALKEDYAWEVVASEYEFLIELAGVKVLGFIDQVVRNKLTGTLLPRDLKSGAKVPEMPLQLGVYRLAMLQDFPNDDVDVSADWVHLGKRATASKPERNVEAIPIDLTDWPEERIARWVYDMDRSEKAGIYLPNPGDKCERLCSVQQFCRAMSWHLPSVEQYAGDSLTIPTIEQGAA